MKRRLASVGESEELRIIELGYEDGASDGKWDKGICDSYAIYYVVEGEGVFNGRRVRYGEGFTVHPGQRLEYRSTGDAPCEYFWIILDGSKVEQICKKYIKANAEGFFTYDFRFGIADFVGTHFANPELMSETHALYLFFYLMSKHETEIFKGKNRYVEEADIFIHLNYQRPISVSDIAAAVNVSDRYLYNLFIKHKGQSPKQSLLRVRERRAEVLLARTKLPIAEVAASVGFSDALAFSRFFSKRTGLSPTGYRKREWERKRNERI